MSKPHPDIAIFLDPNRGNFKPVSDSPSLSPYLGTRSVGGFAYGDAQ
jgi:hypothetical protein